jgi:hypothetical protein
LVAVEAARNVVEVDPNVVACIANEGALEKGGSAGSTASGPGVDGGGGDVAPTSGKPGASMPG